MEQYEYLSKAIDMVQGSLAPQHPAPEPGTENQKPASTWHCDLCGESGALPTGHYESSDHRRRIQVWTLVCKVLTDVDVPLPMVRAQQFVEDLIERGDL